MLKCDVIKGRTAACTVRGTQGAAGSSVCNCLPSLTDGALVNLPR